MARRIIVTVPARTRVVLAPLPCPFVHAKPGERPRCTSCRRLFTASERAEFASACNGDERCELGRHVARLCERCAYAPDYDTRGQEAV